MLLSPKILSFAVMMALGGTAAASPADHALDLLKTHGAAVKASAADQFTVVDSSVEPKSGMAHTRFNRTFHGLPVFGGDFVTHVDRAGQLKSVSMTQRSVLNLSTRPALSSSAAIVAAGALFGSNFTGTPSAKLVVYARGPGAPELAYQVRLQNDNADMTYFVSATPSARIILSYSNNESTAATATARTLYSGNVALTTNSITGGFELRDPTRGNGWTISAAMGRSLGKIYTDTDNAWGDNTNADPATVAVEAQYGVGKTWDFYKNVLGRNGIANDGKGAYSRVHYGNTYVNAYWSDACFCMTYGDGDGVNYGPLVSIDIAGHEMSHGVMARTANLTYSGESGGLNEANSDMMGTMVEFYSNSTLDTPDYLIGEEIYIHNVSGSSTQTALRYMYNPFKDGRSPSCYVSTVGNLDVHYSSGVANHFFYLLAEGTGARTYSGVVHTSTTCNGSSLAGIGRDAATKIWYTAVKNYMVSNTNYSGARAATLASAAELYGPTSAQYNAVAATWSAVNVH